MITALDISVTREYSLPEDKASPRTIFLLGSLDAVLASYLIDNAIIYKRPGLDQDQTNDVILLNRWRQLEVVRFGVKGWKHFSTREGKEAPFTTKEFDIANVGKRQGLTDDSLNYLKPYISQLAFKVTTDNTISEEEEKNSVTPSP
jgi:hypothetical protein